MKKYFEMLIVFVIIVFSTELEAVNYLADYLPSNSDGTINFVVEIPVGTNEKWEIRSNGEMVRDIEDGKPRTIKYLGYPVNYGIIPRTILSKELGGDGDPVDVLAIGAPLKRGSVSIGKVIGVLKLVDRGEVDDKVIVIMPDSQLYTVNSISEMDSAFPGITDIIKTWFANYKGKNKIIINGFGSKEDAQKLIDISIDCYKKIKNKS